MLRRHTTSATFLVILLWVFIKRSKASLASLESSKKDLEDIKYALDETAIVVTTDPAGKITFVNDKFCEISKYKAAELIGKDHRILNSGHHGKEFMQELWSRIQSGKSWRGEIKNKAKDNSYYWVDTTIIPFLDAKGSPFQYIAIRFDITEKKRQEVRLTETLSSLEEKNKELDQFAYIVSHDLKAPLRGMYTLTEFLKEDLAEKLDPDSRENFSLLQGRVKRMEALIMGILSFSKIGRKLQSKEQIDTSRFMKEIVSEINSESSKYNITFTGNFPIVEVNRVYFTQIFQNLVSNAIKYHDQDHGEIEVGYKEENQQHHFWVKDDGPGIPKEYHDRAFEVFQTLQARDDLESTGIGLSIVKKIIESFNGKVWIESEIGQGTTFHITFPI